LPLNVVSRESGGGLPTIPISNLSRFPPLVKQGHPSFVD
jgi:hypothetical protein